MTRGSGTLLLASITVALVLVVYGVARFPESIARDGLLGFLTVLALLAIYALAAVGVRSSRLPAVQAAARIGTRVGLAVAALAAVNHIVEMWVSLPPLFATLFGAGMWGVMFFAFGYAYSATYSKVGSVAMGGLSSVWSALVYAATLVAFAMAIGLVFMPHIEVILAQAYGASGLTDPRAFVVRNHLTSAGSQLVVAPTVALFVAAGAAVARAVLEKVSATVAIVLGVVGVGVFVAGAAAIHFASALDRAQRPPFIMFGLTALAVTLASAHPLFAAIRDRRRVGR